MPLSNNPLVPGTLLLSPGHSVPLLPGGSQKINPVSPLASGPNIIGNGHLTLTAPQFVPVNADNDNNSDLATDKNGKTIPGIATKRDFNVFPITAVGLPPGGAWSIWWTYSGTGKIALWADQKKTAAFTPPGAFYVEGGHESSALNDVTLEFDYTVGGVKYSASTQITVTPLITDFTIKPTLKNGGVWFTVGNNALQGLTTHWQGSPTPGAYFGAQLTDTNLSGNPVFIHNLNKIKNGILGPTNFNGNPVGATFVAGTNPASQSVVITAAAQANGAAFPFLDTPTDTGSPEYPLTSSSNDGNTAIIQSNDSPAVGSTANANSGTAIDVQDSYQLYLVWKYPSGIYYPLAWYLWWVQFYATGPGPVNNIIVPPSGVGVDVRWFPDNSTPGKMIAPIANNSTAWQ
jgi:hypothetical protein